MHHLIQVDMYHEFGFRRLRDAVLSLNLPYGIFSIIPFDDHINWVEGVITGGRVPTMVWGATSVERITGQYGWNPGVFKNENFSMKVYQEKWGPRMLNHDAKFYKLGEVPAFEGTAFIRPVHDSKSFTGQLINDDELDKWRTDLYELRHEFTTLDLDTEVMVASPKRVIDEARFFIVDQKVVAGSMYRVDGRVLYKQIGSDTPLYQPMWDWAQAHCFGERVPGTSMFDLAARGWTPAEAFVMDVARTAEGFSIIEVNCINSAGFYDCDMRQVVMAIEYLKAWPEQWF